MLKYNFLAPMIKNTKIYPFLNELKGSRVGLILSWLIIISIYFLGLNLPLIGPDEPRYSQVAREMIQRSDFITPTLGGVPWLEKPALLYWIQIFFYSIFGVSEFSARLGSAIFGIGTILTIWLLMQASTGDKKLSELTAFILATSIGLITFSHAASFDIILTFPITAALSSFFLGFLYLENFERKKALALFFCFYFFIGIALLAKGLVGIILPFFALFIFQLSLYVLSKKFPHRLFLLTLPMGLLISGLVACTWYLPMYQLHGFKFIDEFIIQHHFARYTSNKYLHPQPFWFFWIVLPLMTLPWTPYFLIAIRKLIRNLRHEINIDREAHATEAKLIIFAISWILSPLLFFSFSGSKLPGYILPSLPATAILIAIYLNRNKSNIIEHLKYSALLIVLLIAIVFISFADLFIRHETLKPLIEKSNQMGYQDAKILNLHTISHNLEFYGAGRLVRLADGKQRYFYGPAEILEFMRVNNENLVLVVVPFQYETDITQNSSIQAEKIGYNGELILFAVRLKDD